MSTFRFLHLTDLHFGMTGQAHLWPNVEEQFLADLEKLSQRVGPWNLVLFTGDLTQRGSKAEFDEVEKLFQKLWAKFKEWGCTPELLVVPGNHDLVRPTDQSDAALINLLHSWHLPAVQAPFWDKADSPQRQIVANAFANFTHWWAHTSIPKPEQLKNGLLPGDCSASFAADGFTLGVAGLNTAYLQLADGDFEGKLHLDVRQLHAVGNGHAADWSKQHDACLLLTHHPVEWLSPFAKQHFSDEIHYPPDRFALHLLGHMHDGGLTTIAHGGGGDRRRLQGASLFGLEHWGEQQAQRLHGYSLGELKLENSELGLRIWPRRAESNQGGGRKIVPDHSFDLIEEDGGTRRIVVKGMNPQARKAAIPQPASPKLSANTVANYDPRNPPFHIPYRQKGDQVIGRALSLQNVRQQLIAGRRTAIGQTALFQGLGGLGKTQLAVEYAYRYRADYPNGVIWLTADQDMDAQLVDLAVKARWAAPESEHSFKLEIAKHRLHSYSDCLIVFDNLEQMASIAGYLPEPPAEAHILVTSRTEQPEFTYVPIDVLDPAQSLQMLTQEAGREPGDEAEMAAAEAIAKRLGGLPLALELAGAYLARRPVGWQQYLDLLQHNLKQALPARLSSLTRHEADLFSTLEISANVFSEEPRLEDVLDVLTWSAAAPMSIDLLATLTGVADHSELTGALGLGTALRLLQKTPGLDDYSIHRLVREVRREQLPLAEKPTWAIDLCQRVGDWFYDLREDFQQLPKFEAALDHLREWHDHSLRFSAQQASRLTWLQAYPLYHRGLFQEIRLRIELAFKEYDAQACDDRPLLAHLRSDLAYAHNALCNSKFALELAEQALSIRRELFGDRHTDTASSLNNVASYNHALGNPKRALQLAEQALSIQREIFGDRHPDTASSLNNVASYTYALGNPKRALELAEQALVIRRELFSDRHPGTATTLNNVAGYTYALGNPKRALQLAEQALLILRELFGERHPATAIVLYNIAALELKLGKTAQAHARAETAYQIEKDILGPQHPETLQTAKLLADIKRPGFRVPSSKKTGKSNNKQKRKS